MSFRSNRSGILSVTFGDGVTAYTRVIQVQQTYGGLVLGRPSPESNQHHILELPAQVHRAFGLWPVVVIPAEEDLIVRQPEQNCSDTETEAWLPEFEMWSWFESDKTKNCAMHGSCLSLVWHQGTPYPFIQAEVLSKMQALRWLDLAADYGY